MLNRCTEYEQEGKANSPRRVESNETRTATWRLAWVDHSVSRLAPSEVAHSMHTRCGFLAQATRPIRNAPRSLLVTLRLGSAQIVSSPLSLHDSRPVLQGQTPPLLRYATDAFSSDNCCAHSA